MQSPLKITATDTLILWWIREVVVAGQAGWSPGKGRVGRAKWFIMFHSVCQRMARTFRCLSPPSMRSNIYRAQHLPSICPLAGTASHFGKAIQSDKRNDAKTGQAWNWKNVRQRPSIEGEGNWKLENNHGTVLELTQWKMVRGTYSWRWILKKTLHKPRESFYTSNRGRQGGKIWKNKHPILRMGRRRTERGTEDDEISDYRR